MVAAQWKLARVYAEGDGVEQSDIKAFEYFSRIANGHADDNPGGPQARYIANAFVSLGHYYREGIADSDVKADLGRARHMYAYAASYFADADAQYHLGRLLLDGSGANNDPRQAARWLYSAANKGQYQAQAVLGRMLFKGENNLPRQPARGLMWLAVAHSNAGTADAWIGELYESALKQASNDERADARRPAGALASTAGASSVSSGSRYFASLSTSSSIHTGTWSDGRSQARTCLSMPAVTSRSAACGESSRWSMRMPLFFCQAPAW